MLSQSNRGNPIACIFGATASGKSQLGIALQRRWPIEIICVDSATIYRGMDIGTAKPSLQEQKECPHHLLDILDPSESYSVGDFITAVHELIPQIQARQRIPVLLGGTMMYFHALQNGLHALPSSNEAVRNEILKDAENLGWDQLYYNLQQKDPTTAARFSVNDKQRIQRAWEIIRLTGKTVSEIYASSDTITKSPYRFENLSLETDDRALLHQRIALRFQQMMELGLLQEVKNLYTRGDLHSDLPSIRCVGYRQLWQYFTDNHQDSKPYIEQAVAATRQLAKRQITWQRSVAHKTVVTSFSHSMDEIAMDWFARTIAKHTTV